jgi:hypothetical protein
MSTGSTCRERLGVQIGMARVKSTGTTATSIIALI